MPVLQANGVQLHYDVHGDGPPLILAHVDAQPDLAAT